MTKIILRNDTTANWESVNPILSEGEVGIDTTTNQFKIGNGTNTWTQLEYTGGSSELDKYLTGTTNENTTTISTDGKALTLDAPTIAVGNNLVNEINGEDSQLYLKQGDVEAGENISVERTATGIKINSTASGEEGLAVTEINNTDLNTLLDSGYYYITTDGNTNLPDGSNGYLLVLRWENSTGDVYAKQMFMRHGSNMNNQETFVRQYNTDTWTDWGIIGGTASNNIYGTNLNDYTVTGTYYFSESTSLSNQPTGVSNSGSRHLIVVNAGNETGNLFQLFSAYNSGTMGVWVRGRLSNSWGSWLVLDNSDCVKLTGNQTIAGTKTFVQDIMLGASITKPGANALFLKHGTTPILISQSSPDGSSLTLGNGSVGQLYLQTTGGKINGYDVLTTKNAFKQVKLTQEQYDALESKDENTVYIITDSPSIDNMADYVVEVSPASLLPGWYRVWKSGRLEQGGRQAASQQGTVHLYKSYSNTNFQVIPAINIADYDATYFQMSIGSKTTSSFNYVSTSGSSRTASAFDWMAVGYVTPTT